MIKLDDGGEKWVRLLPPAWAISWTCPFALGCPGCLVIRRPINSVCKNGRPNAGKDKVGKRHKRGEFLLFLLSL